MPSDDPELPGQITLLLHDWSERGDEAALEELLSKALPELRRMARGRLRREPREVTLQSMELVDAAWLKLGPQTKKAWRNRRHFYAVFSQAMFQVLIDEADRRHARKRAGTRVPLEEESWAVKSGGIDVDMMDFALALAALARERPRAAEAAKMRYLGGMTEEEIAFDLRWDGKPVSIATVRRDLKVAKSHLFRTLRGGAGRAAEG